ncbi:hypothetical protein [Ferruginibacter profundus]
MKLKRLFYTLTVLLSCILPAKSQTNWKNREDSLWNLLYTNKTMVIDSNKRWEFFLMESGSLGGMQVWFDKQATIDASFLTEEKIERKKTLTLIIPNNYKFIESGEEHFKVYLLNFSNKTLYIPRIDATLDSISEYIKIDNNWFQLRKNLRSSCGNSYYKKRMLPNEANLFEIASINQEAGTKVLKYKLVFNYYGREIQSNEIEIKLFANQVKRFLSEGTDTFR